MLLIIVETVTDQSDRLLLHLGLFLVLLDTFGVLCKFHRANAFL